MKRSLIERMIGLMVFAAALLPSAAYAQFDATCSAVLSCNPSASTLAKDPLLCLKSRTSTEAARCKKLLLPYKEHGTAFAFGAPLIILIAVVIVGAVKLSPASGWAHGTAVGALLSGFILCAADDLLPFLSVTKPYLEHLLFPVVGILSFVPEWVNSFPFGFRVFLANCLLYGGAYGFMHAKRKHASWFSVLYLSFAMLFSFADALFV